MTIVAAIPLLFAILGLLLYFIATNTKAQEVGRLLFACGALVTLFGVAGHTFRLG